MRETDRARRARSLAVSRTEAEQNSRIMPPIGRAAVRRMRADHAPDNAGYLPRLVEFGSKLCARLLRST